MSYKAKKQASSASFTMSRWYEKISTMKPSVFVVSLVAVAAAIFLFSGGLYTIIVKPLPALYFGGRFYFLYPELGSQFVFDTVVAATLYVLGFIGMIAIYQSTKHAYNPRQAYMMLVIGVTLLLLAYIFLEDLIFLKLSS